MTSSKPDHFPKAPPPPNIITWRVKAPTYKSGGDTNI